MLELKQNQTKPKFNLVQCDFRFASTFCLILVLSKFYVKFLLRFAYTYMLDF